jgi:hypothetical protein
MLGFKQWYDEIRDWCIKYHRSDEFSKKGELYYAWRRALKWYQLVADECEKDCSTDKDYKVLYFHLKQVLINEMKE